MKSIIVSAEWLASHLQDENLVIVDCRFALGQPESGKALYDEEHIPRAHYLDLERDLSASKEKHGGRHPMPKTDELALKLGNIGINTDKTVVAYDDQAGAMASRLWWLLTYMGLENVYILDHGFTDWKKAGYKTTSELPKTHPVTFTPVLQKHMLATMEEVKHKLNTEGVTLIDSREAIRYRGEHEPIDPVAGHIPGAINHFWKDSLNAEGAWKSADEQVQRFQTINSNDEVIVYCGSGVTACPNVVSLREAGFSNVKLYLGSWSDWISYPENPIER